MLYRKITSYIEDYLKSDNDKILILEGARQIGKSFSIREVGARLYPNFVEINFVEDDEGEQLFKNIHKKEDFYLTLSMVAGDKLNNRKQGEVDYLVDNHQAMSAHPIEVKSGKDYTIHSALNNLLKNPEYNVLATTVLSNERKVYQEGKVTYMPVYFVMFMENDTPLTDVSEYYF